MAHFAKLDENNVVTQVIVVANEDTTDTNGVEVEEIGVAFCKKLLGAETNWKQTSYNNNFRVRYAGTGYSYNAELNAFIAPKPFESWVLVEATAGTENLGGGGGGGGFNVGSSTYGPGAAGGSGIVIIAYPS